MNHLTKLMINSIISKNIHQLTFLIQKQKIPSHFVRLINKNCFFEGSFKSRGFKNGQNDIPFAEYMRKSINKFPYCKLPKYNQRFSQQKQLQPEEYEALVAFSSLFVINEANKQKQLKQMAEILLKQEFQNIVYDRLTGTQIFSLYYVKKLPEIVRSINEDNLTEERATYYMQVLTNILPTPQIKGFIHNLKQEKIANMSTHIQSLYVKLLLKHNLSYIHFIDKLYQSFTAIKDQEQNINRLDRLQAAKCLLSIQNFQQLLSENIKTLCLRVIIESITKIQAFDHIMIIKHIYMSNSALCKEYVERLTAEIMSLHHKKKSDQLHVPLMLKVIKYRSKLHLNNKMFLEIINSYPEKFNTVFRQKNVNKEIFLSLTTKESTTNLNPEIRSQFGSYIRKVFDEYEKKDEIDEDQLVRNIKLILKYGNQIQRDQLTIIFEILVNDLYQRIKHAASDDLKYYIFLVTYTFNFQQTLKHTNLVQEVISTYHNKCSTKPDSESIARMINIEYQLCRKDTDSSMRRNIFVYDYNFIDLPVSVYSYFIFLMKKQKSKGTNEEKANVLAQLKKNIYKNLSKGSFSMKILYTLIDVLEELKYSDKYIYMDIERAIGKNLERAISGEKRKNSDMPLPKDIMFLKHKLSKNSKCSSKFDQFLDLCDKNYNLINDYAKDYIQKSKNWQKIRQNYKRNRQIDKTKSQPKGRQTF